MRGTQPTTPGMQKGKGPQCPGYAGCKQVAASTDGANTWGVSTHTQGGEQLKTPWSSLEATQIKSLKKKKPQHLFYYFQPAMYVMTRPGEITKSPNPYKTSGTPYPVSQEQPSLPGSTRKTQLGLCFLRSPQRYLSCDRSPNSSYKGRPRKEALNSYKFFKRLHPGAVQGGKVHAETFSFREHRAAFSSRDNCLHLAVTVNTSREVPHQRQSC